MKKRSEGAAPRLARRDFLKAAAGVPVLALFGFGMAQARPESAPPIAQSPNVAPSSAPPKPFLEGAPLRVAIIGTGHRGTELLRLCLLPELNLQVTGICDVFDRHAERALDLAHQSGHRPRRFRTYHEAIVFPEVDAVIIATPDHWHGPMAIDAARAKRHIYLESCMSHGIGETFALRDAVKRSGIVFQLGHQRRQMQSLPTARSMVEQQALGHVSLVQVLDGGGTAQRSVERNPDANARTVDWHQFLGSAPARAFDPDHLFDWRKWWSYGSGPSGELFAHQFDLINAVLRAGIPQSVTASGGIYAATDGREVPDALQVTMEFPAYANGSADRERGLSFSYSATLGSGYGRPPVLMGRDASMEVGQTLRVHAAPHSPRYAQTGADPLFVYAPSNNQITAIDSRSLDYFSEPQTEQTYRDGRLYEATYLHLHEWLRTIRHGDTPSCGIDAGFQTAIATHMTTLAYRLGKRIEWDAGREQLKNVTRSELASLRMG